jgi:hypothetical protein
MELARYQSGIVEFSNSRQFGSAAKLSARGAQEIVTQLKPKKSLNEKHAADDDDPADDDDGPTKEPVATSPQPEHKPVVDITAVEAGWPLCSVTDPVVLEERKPMIVKLADLMEGVGPKSGARLTVHDLMEVLIEVWEPEQLEALHGILDCRIANSKAMTAPPEQPQPTAH